MLLLWNHFHSPSGLNLIQISRDSFENRPAEYHNLDLWDTWESGTWNMFLHLWKWIAVSFSRHYHFFLLFFLLFLSHTSFPAFIKILQAKRVQKEIFLNSERANLLQDPNMTLDGHLASENAKILFCTRCVDAKNADECHVFATMAIAV